MLISDVKWSNIYFIISHICVHGMHKFCMFLDICYIYLRIYIIILKPFLNSFLAKGDFCCLLITFANNLDLDQDRHFVGPDLARNCLTLIVFLIFLKKNCFEKISR